MSDKDYIKEAEEAIKRNDFVDWKTLKMSIRFDEASGPDISVYYEYTKPSFWQRLKIRFLSFMMKLKGK